MRSQMRRHLGEQPLRDADRAILVEGGMVAEGAQEQLQRLGFDDASRGRIVDHQMREVGLAGHRAERGELGRGEAHQIGPAGARIGDIVEHGLLGAGGQRAGLAEMGEAHAGAR